MSTLAVSRSNPSYGALVASKHVGVDSIRTSLEDRSDTVLSHNGLQMSTSSSILRYLARSHPEQQLYGSSAIQRTEVDHWLDVSNFRLSCPTEFAAALAHLDYALGPVTHLVGHMLTIADMAVWGALRGSGEWQQLLVSGTAPQHVHRYYRYLSAQPGFKEADDSLPKPQAVSAIAQASEGGKKERKDEGKFIELPGAEMGKVVVRFPPEASGFLHIGHAKAALLNQHYQHLFQGCLIMRFDDTNPAKESAEFEKVILEDIALLGVKPDVFSHTSDHFELMLKYADQLLREGKAYVDDTDPETMKAEREERKPSKNRDNTVNKNLAMWDEMKRGTDYGKTCAVRAKMDMSSDNGCLRDPTIYRCKVEPHVRTGYKYKVYPTYDFACPIVDSIEGVTHALRTTEYMDRDDQFYWFIEALGLRKPYIWAYSRLNLQNTVMSKRKLTWFVDQGLVEGWEDPRFPTVRGVMRRGMTVEGLKQFIIAQGSSRSVVMMDWEKIWAFNKKVIDPVVPRLTALEKDKVVLVNVAGAKPEVKTVAKHPKNADVGTKQVRYGPKVFIDGADAETLSVGEVVTFINWGNLIIKSINRAPGGSIQSVDAQLNLENTDYKKTTKLTWLAESVEAPFVPTTCVTYDHIISKAVLGREEDFKNFINPNSKFEQEMLGDPELASLKKGDVIQLQRRGFFICDVAYQPPSRYSGREGHCILFHIPDGHVKDTHKAGSKHKDAGKDSSAKERAQTGKGKAAEKSPQEEKAPSSVGPPAGGSQSGAELNARVAAQGDQVRQLKSQKADKATVDAAVKVLLALKAEFKAATGQEWKSGMKVPAAAATAKPAKAGAGNAAEINDKITAQGDKIRQLKAAKVPKATVDAEVKVLLSLKAEFKAATGQEWKPDMKVPAAAATAEPAKAGTGNAAEINDKITAQGGKIRQLKADKVPKATVDAEVKVLLSLKAEFKAATGQEWKPDMKVPVAAAMAEPVKAATGNAAEINDKITVQGDKIRQLKADKAPKATLDAEIKVLLSLKAEFKAAAGRDWKPGMKVPVTGNPAEINDKITAQGEKIRQLKADKVPKAQIDPEVKVLLALKADYKEATGENWNPGCKPPPSAPSTTMPATADSADAQQLKTKIDEQGNVVRDLKSKKADKASVDAAVKALLDLKIQYKDLTGEDLAGGGRNKGPKTPKPAQNAPKGAAAKGGKQQKNEAEASGREVKKVTRLGMEARKEEDLPEWYSQIITKAELIEYYDVSGCYVLRPWSFGIWEAISKYFDDKIKSIGFQNCYFPIFVSNAALQKEKDHIEDFAPEVAWVTKSGDSELAEPIAIRPTSETVMYPAYSKWVQSHRDLPIKLNQWCNVVRWEFKHPQPFLRTREFLWQEGHSAYATYKEAEEEVYQIIDWYEEIYETQLAIPVVKGRKTEKEKFAGGDFTTTVEAYISATGRGIQAATSHHLGQNFSRMFDISFEDPDSHEKCFAYQNSWAITTRSIGVIVMVHGDNKGLILPPNIAVYQAVIVPCGITASLPEADKKAIIAKCEDVEKQLRADGIRVKGDYRDNVSPGWKFNHWELKGVPLRIEIGARDIQQQQLVLVRRDTAAKSTHPWAGAGQVIQDMLKTIQQDMFNKAKRELDASIAECYDFEQFCDALNQRKMLLAPFCGGIPCEENIKKLSARDAVVEEGAPAMGAKGLCIPFNQPRDITDTMKCICPDCPDKPKNFTLFGRSY